MTEDNPFHMPPQAEMFWNASLFAKRICDGDATKHECLFMRDYLAMDVSDDRLDDREAWLLGVTNERIPSATK